MVLECIDQHVQQLVAPHIYHGQWLYQAYLSTPCLPVKFKTRLKASHIWTNLTTRLLSPQSRFSSANQRFAKVDKFVKIWLLVYSNTEMIQNLGHINIIFKALEIAG